MSARSQPAGDEALMRAALAEARKGLGKTGPNPAVGAVISKGGKILSRGWHRGAGKPHAEIEALRNLKNPALARGATLPYEEAKYSYITVSRIPIAYSGARVLHDTTTHKGYITLEHCSSRGIMTSSVPKRQRDAYRLARDAQWGSWLPDSTLFPAE